MNTPMKFFCGDKVKRKSNQHPRHKPEFEQQVCREDRQSIHGKQHHYITWMSTKIQMFRLCRRVHGHVVAKMFFGTQCPRPMEKESMISVLKPGSPHQP